MKSQHFKAHNVIQAHHVSSFLSCFLMPRIVNLMKCEMGRDGSRIKPAVLAGLRMLMLIHSYIQYSV